MSRSKNMRSQPFDRDVHMAPQQPPCSPVTSERVQPPLLAVMLDPTPTMVIGLHEVKRLRSGERTVGWPRDTMEAFRDFMGAVKLKLGKGCCAEHVVAPKSKMMSMPSAGRTW